MNKEIRALVRSMNLRGYKIATRPYELNIVGVRADTTTPNRFDDNLYVFWKTDKSDWEGKKFPATTDPGTYFLKNPINDLGAALLKGGQYVDAYQIGLHRGSYEALIQVKPVTVFRDYNRDAILDFNNGKEDTGLFGINIHKSGNVGTTLDVDRWSAGCQVFANVDDFNRFIELAKKHRELYGNKFTYTLIDERAFRRAIKRRGLYFALAGLVAVAGFFGYRRFRK